MMGGNLGFYGKCNKCGKIGNLFEELISLEECPINEKDYFEYENNKGEKFKIGKMLCRECSKNEPRSILNR